MKYIMLMVVSTLIGFLSGSVIGNAFGVDPFKVGGGVALIMIALNLMINHDI